MNTFLTHLSLAAPLFVLVLAGYLIARSGRFPAAMAEALNRFVFTIALPALLFRMMADLSSLPPVDARLLAAFFGGCLVVFVLGRLAGWALFRLDGVQQSVFALGGIFSNNVLLGIPIAKLTLGEAALPAVALVLVFNALVLWTLVTVSVEWARHGEFSARGFGRTAVSVITNPIVAAIVGGTLFGLTGLSLPVLVDEPLKLVGQAAALCKPTEAERDVGRGIGIHAEELAHGISLSVWASGWARAWPTRPSSRRPAGPAP